MRLERPHSYRSRAFLLVLGCLMTGCGGARKDIAPLVSSTSPTGQKVLIVGIDGATFSVLDPLIAQGRTPQLKALIDKGARGVLRSLNPTASPAIWTTIATGREPRDHGITDFTVTRWKGFRRERVLVSDNERRTQALWTMLGPFGKSAGFVGWWASWPAEPVRGWMISDRMTRSRFTEWMHGNRQEFLTFPADLEKELRPLVVDPLHSPVSEIRALVDLSDEELAEFEAASRPIFAHGLSVLKFAYSEQRSYEEIALHMLSAPQPDLTGVFLVANDPVCHTFWHFYEPSKFRGVDPGKAERLGRIIPNLYEHNDRYLSKLMKRIDPETTVFVVSDHGFEASGEVPVPRSRAGFSRWFDAEKSKAMKEGTVAVGQSGRHNLDGILIVSGGSIRRGVEVRASVLDIAPTILALLGLPVARDMEGRVLEEIIEPGFLAGHPIRTIDSYEEYIPRVNVPETGEGSEADHDRLEALRSLGYVQ